MTIQNEELHDVVERFMNSNYPCQCPPTDTECPKNYHESDHIIGLVADKVLTFIASLPEDYSRDRVVSSLNTELFGLKNEGSNE